MENHEVVSIVLSKTTDTKAYLTNSIGTVTGRDDEHVYTAAR